MFRAMMRVQNTRTEAVQDELCEIVYSYEDAELQDDFYEANEEQKDPQDQLQEMIKGDVDTLPHFAQWLSLALLPDEVMVWGSEDISCAFYVFALPDAWGPYFVLHWPVPGSLAGLPNEAQVYLTLSVIPMGWTSAVGICQHCMRRLNALPSPLGAGLPPHAELRKDRSQPVDLSLIHI